jgi:hypothetical protein
MEMIMYQDREVRGRRGKTMRDRRVRLLFLGLILAFPMLISALATEGPRSSRGSIFPTVFLSWIEIVIVAGLLFVGQQRRRLLADRREAPSPPRPGDPAPVPVVRR